MSGILYLQIDDNIMVQQPHICLQDIARLSCNEPEILHRVRVIPVITLDPDKPGRYVMSVMDLVDLIQKKEPELEIVPLGQPDFILTYDTGKCPNPLWRLLKITVVCLISFFGGAFSIMTFNNDVDIGTLFSRIYTQVTGHTSSGFTILEISYSVGLGVGILFFFNHFGKKKITSDPTPMQVQMRLYEDNINTTLRKDAGRFHQEK